MAFKISKSDDRGVRVTLDERVWLTRDGDLVKEGDERAASLYCAAGRSVLRDDYEERCAVKAPKNPISRRQSFRPQVALDAKDEEPKPKAKPKAKPKPKNKSKAKPKNKGKGE